MSLSLEKPSTANLAYLIEHQSSRYVKMAYQPKIDLRLSHVSGYESLLRWRNDNGVLISPEDVIRTSEEAGIEVSNNLLKTIITSVCRSISAVPETLRLPTAVNVNPLQVSGKLGRFITDTASDFGIDPLLIEIEITEHLPMGDQRSFASRLRELTGMGFAVWVDDFGAGNKVLPRLASLRDCGLYGIKLDQDFVRNAILTEGQTILHLVTRMCQSIGLKVVVEGVESEDEHAFVACAGCDYGQGYVYGRPVDSVFSGARIPRACTLGATVCVHRQSRYPCAIFESYPLVRS